MTRLSWYMQDETMTEEGIFAEEEVRIPSEKRILTEMGAPDVEQIEVVSTEAESWEDMIITANVTPAFAEWAKINLPTA